MVTKIARVKSTGSVGEKGPSHLVVGPNKFKVTFDESQKVYKGLRTEIPDTVIALYTAWQEAHKNDPADDGLAVYASLSGDNETLLGVRPLNGIFRAICLGFQAQNEGDSPKPIEKEGKYGIYMGCIPMFKIVKGPWAESLVPAWYIYRLAETEDGNTAIPSGRNGDRLTDFLTVTGVMDFGELPFTDNELVEWDKRIKQAKKPLQIILKGGFLDTVIAYDGIDDTPIAQRDLVPAENVITPPATPAPKPVDADDDL